jgi:hypothetical protein
MIFFVDEYCRFENTLPEPAKSTDTLPPRIHSDNYNLIYPIILQIKLALILADKNHYSNGFFSPEAREAVQETQQRTIEEGGVVLVGVVSGLWMTINSRNFVKLSSILMVVFKHPHGVKIKMEFI